MAWPTDRRPDDALTGELVPEVWSTRIINHVRANLVAAQVVNTGWKDQLVMGDKVNIAVAAALTAGDVDVTTTGVLTNMNTTFGTTAESITIDSWKEVPVQIDDSVKVQSHIGNILGIMADNAAFALEKIIDLNVGALYSALNGGTVQGSDGQTFSDDILIAMHETLDEADVPKPGRSLVGDPSTEADIRKIDKFVRLDFQDGRVVTTGQLGTLYGTPVFMTNNLTAATTGNYGVLMHRDAIGLVIQDGPTVEPWREHKRHSDIINVSAMYGVDEVRDTFGVPFYTRSS
ncbi:hypothetical protein LCGC14_1202490 [marine sediment metagenome]|uniref:Capsid protein n=1 Tax=marine sediment metagenome TaxID=412755 RepID=A0A0F9M3S7_9ZZZZ